MTEYSSLTQLAILVTARWAVNGAKPLTNGEYFVLRRWLGSDPDAVLGLLSGQRNLDGCPIDTTRLEGLLGRGLGVFQSIDRWTQAGLWVRSWSDNDYPSRFKQLRLRAPALLFGYGKPEAFSERALAVVGSRNATEERLAKTSEIARACARAGIAVISGGARGVDSVAMKSCIAGGGMSVGVLADSLLKESGKRDYREAIVDRRLCLMSEVYPEARFDVGNAMARNRLAYACADAALVIECDAGKGGTWQGAMEARREGKAVYVLRGARAEHELTTLGAIPIDIEFALQPDRLIQAQRPDSILHVTAPVEQLLRDLTDNGTLDVDGVAHRLRTESQAIAQRLVALTPSTHNLDVFISHTLMPSVEATVADAEPVKPRRKRGKKGLDSVTLFDGAGTTV
jgi:predicted Rossmann fold nucleotide-binding protein DprA/Smf involved in DNA uptake